MTILSVDTHFCDMLGILLLNCDSVKPNFVKLSYCICHFVIIHTHSDIYTSLKDYRTMESDDSESVKLSGPIEEDADLFKSYRHKLQNTKVKNPRASHVAARGEVVMSRRTLRPCPICCVKTKQVSRHLKRQHRDVDDNTM